MSKSNPKQQSAGKTKVLELRQTDDTSTTVNGDFQTSFEPFSMTEGDSVVLKSCILDTTQSSLTKVVVEKDLTLTINALPYVVNYQYNDKGYLTGTKPADGTPTESTRQPDHGRYFAMQLFNGTSASHRVIQSVVFKYNSATFKIPYFAFSVYYKDVNGDLVYTQKVYKCPETKARGHHDGQKAVTVPINISLLAWGGGSFPDPIVPELSSYNLDDITATFHTSLPESSGGTFQPIVLTHNIPVKAGSYDPLSLCKVINDSVNQNSTGDRALQAPFLQESDEYGKRYFKMDLVESTTNVTNIESVDSAGVTLPDTFPLPIGTIVTGSHILDNTTITTYNHTLKTATLSQAVASGGTQTGVLVTASNSIVMVKENNTNDADGFYFFNSHLNPSKHSSLFGSSQLQLDVDQATNKFQWKYLHTPYYDPTTGNQALYFNHALSKIFKIGSTSGVAISNLSATVTGTSEPSLFWSSQLGFSDGTVEGTVSQCNAQVGEWLKKPRVGPFSDVMFPVITNVNTSTTSQFIGSDDAVQKVGVQAGTSPAFTYTDQQFYALSSSTSFKATADPDSTNAVIASTPYTELVGNATGYFKIDIQGLAPTELVSSAGTSRSVQAVVTRYYNDGNFTSGSQDSGIVYQHVGAPKMISNLRTRILDPDNTIANGLGPDNTIFLEILKI